MRGRRIEPVRAGEADALITLAPVPVLLPLAELSAEQWRERFRIWAAEPFWAFQAWLRDVLSRQVAGRWIAVTSTLGAQPFPGGGADGAGAVAIQTLVRVASVEYGPRGVRANAIACGWRDPTIPADLDRDLILADTPSGRLLSETDIAGAVAWLLSDDAAQLNGTILRLDGGYTITGGSRRDPRRE